MGRIAERWPVYRRVREKLARVRYAGNVSFREQAGIICARRRRARQGRHCVLP